MNLKVIACSLTSFKKGKHVNSATVKQIKGSLQLMNMSRSLISALLHWELVNFRSMKDISSRKDLFLLLDKDVLPWKKNESSTQRRFHTTVIFFRWNMEVSIQSSYHLFPLNIKLSFLYIIYIKESEFCNFCI